MKDELLEEALDNLKEEARDFCEEKGLSLEENLFSVEISKNLVHKITRKVWGIPDLIKETRKAIFLEFKGRRTIEDGEAMMFYIGDETGLSAKTGTQVRIGIFDQDKVRFFCLI